MISILFIAISLNLELHARLFWHFQFFALHLRTDSSSFSNFYLFVANIWADSLQLPVTLCESPLMVYLLCLQKPLTPDTLQNKRLMV
jgi:hypothetical protein